MQRRTVVFIFVLIAALATGPTSSSKTNGTVKDEVKVLLRSGAEEDPGAAPEQFDEQPEKNSPDLAPVKPGEPSAADSASAQPGKASAAVPKPGEPSAADSASAQPGKASAAVPKPGEPSAADSASAQPGKASAAVPKPVEPSAADSAEAEKTSAADSPATKDESNENRTPGTPPKLDIDSAFLYTKGYEDGMEYEIITADNSTISKSDFQAGAKTFIIIHGFTSRATAPWIISLKDKILEKIPESNVVAVQWSSRAGSNFSYEAYNETLQYIPPLGASVARLVVALDQAKGLDYKKVHVIGFNLGAHIAGFAGKASPSPLGRITGLDPANKGYLHTAAAQRLDKTDAFYVDIMHSNSCNNWNVWSDCFGIFQSIGDTDFWPNGGMFQPACKGKKNDGLRCDHTIVTDYFIESFAYSIDDTRFLARPAKNYNAYKIGNASCGSYPQYMGILADSNSIGDYFLNTSSSRPYALLDEGCPNREHQRILTDAAIAAIVIFVIIVVLVIASLVFYKVRGIFRKKSDEATDPILGDDDDRTHRIVDGQEQPARSSILSGVARGFADIINRPVDV